MKLVRLPADKDDVVTLAPLFDFRDADVISDPRRMIERVFNKKLIADPDAVAVYGSPHDEAVRNNEATP